MRMRLTETMLARLRRMPDVQAALEGPDARASVWDEEERSLELRLTAKGAATWRVCYRVPDGTGGGKLVRKYLVLGRWPAMSLGDARAAAEDVRTARRDAKDPVQERKRAKAEERAARTLGDWWEEWSAIKRERGDWRESTSREAALLWRNVLAPAFGGQVMRSLDAGEVEAWHREEGKRAPVQANRALTLLRTLLADGIRRGLFPGPNPADGIRRHRETARERFLSPDEARTLWEAIAAEEELGGVAAVARVGKAAPGRGGKGMREARSRGVSPAAASLFRLLMLTGARLSEIREARWDELDLAAGALRVPAERNKTRRPKAVWLNELALAEVGKLAAARVKGSPWLVPGRDGEGPLQNATKPWGRVLRRANALVNEARAAAGLAPLAPGPFAGLRLHDLRHSFASAALAEGLPLAFVSKALGHASQTTTARYGHLADDPARAPARAVGDALARTLGGAEVVDVTPAPIAAGKARGRRARGGEQ